jgi:hypothetical protein
LLYINAFEVDAPGIWDNSSFDSISAIDIGIILIPYKSASLLIASPIKKAELRS